MSYNNTTNGGTYTNDGTIANNSPVIRAAIYSEMMMEEIQDGFLPEGLHRDVSDFSDGSRILIPQMGEVTVTDIAEDDDMSSTAQAQIGLSNIELKITEYKGAMTAITDEMKQDSYKAMEIEASMPRKHLRAIREQYETNMLATAGGATQITATAGWSAGAYGDGATPGDNCIINGAPHRWVAAGTDQVITLDDFISAKLSLDKANIPYEGRIAIVDPVVEATLNTLVGAQAFSAEQHWGGYLESGFAANMKFFGNIYGFDIFISNRNTTLGASDADLLTFADAYASTGSAVETDGLKSNIFMSVLDPEVMPLMGAWRKMPSIEGDRNVPKRRDEFYSTARWGFGLQRPESLVTVATNAAKY